MTDNNQSDMDALRVENRELLKRLGELEGVRSELLQLEQLHKNIIESMSDGVLALDRDFHYTLWNRSMEKMSKVAREEVIGADKFPWEIFPHLAEQGVDELMKAAMRGEVTGRDDIPFHLPNGSTGFTCESYFPLLNESGEFDGVVGIIRDVTDRKEAEQEQEALREKVRDVQRLESLGVLAGGIAHDFNNLLMSILGNAELALAEKFDRSKIEESLQAVIFASKHARDLTQEMLAYAGKGSISIEEIDLNTVVNELATLLRSSISKKVSLRLDLAPDLPAIWGDHVQIQQVVLNLITNASESHGDSVGEIVLKTEKRHCNEVELIGSRVPEIPQAGDFVSLTVSDRGSGMDGDALGRIFDPFYTTKVFGRGLGMAAVLGIVRSHNGALLVESEPGAGTTFSVLLSQNEDRKQIARVPRVTESDPEWRGSGVVLLVDDESIVCAVVANMLIHVGFNVVCCENPEEAISRFKEAPDSYVCGLFDYNMPQMNGIDLLHEMRKMNPELPVLVASGYHEQELEKRLAGLEDADFIQKPFNIPSLAGKLKILLGAGAR